MKQETLINKATEACKLQYDMQAFDYSMYEWYNYCKKYVKLFETVSKHGDIGELVDWDEFYKYI